MASSSKKSMKGRGGSSSGKGGPSIVGGVTTPRGSEDNSSSSDSFLGSSKPLGDILGRPTVAYVTGVVRDFLLSRQAFNHHRRTGSGWL